MALEINSSNPVCTKCGKSYSRRKGFFPVSHATQHKGIGYIPVCRDCIESMYNQYLSVCNNPKVAVRQMCRKLDVYWNEKEYEKAELMNTPKTIMTHYLRKLTPYNLAGKCYDDSLIEEGTLWYVFKDDYIKALQTNENKDYGESQQEPEIESEEEQIAEDIDIPENVIAFWGNGFDSNMYLELEQRKAYWMSQLPKDLDSGMGTMMLIKQICILELDINNNIINGKPVDKSINSLNTLLGSLNLKPTQQKTDGLAQELLSTPLGVWIHKFENDLPLPEVDEQLKDVNKIKKYIFTWMGHLCKMMGVKNGYTRLYEEEIERLRVTRPEYDDEEDLIYDAYSEESECYE